MKTLMKEFTPHRYKTVENFFKKLNEKCGV
jgi:hypothetical protein